jgi:hypothetical protein
VYSTPSSTTEEPPGSTAASTTAAIQALQLNGKPGYEDQAGRASANDATARLAVLLFCAMAAIADHPEGRVSGVKGGGGGGVASAVIVPPVQWVPVSEWVHPQNILPDA